MKYKQGDIVLVPYPYTDLSTIKQRPVVIISKNSINKTNLIVAKITSVIKNDKFSFSLRDTELTIALPFQSEVRTADVMTVATKIVRKKLTTLQQSVLQQLIAKIITHLSLSNA